MYFKISHLLNDYKRIDCEGFGTLVKTLVILEKKFIIYIKE